MYQKIHIRLEFADPRKETDTVPVATNQPERNKRSGNNRDPKQERKIYRLKMMFPSPKCIGIYFSVRIFDTGNSEIK